MEIRKKFKPQAIIFDKDGTLIDFDFMWGGWAAYLAEKLHAASGLNIHEPLYLALGYDSKNKKVLANGKLASHTMAQIYEATVQVMLSLGLSQQTAGQIVKECWYIPDPVRLAKPLTNIRALFEKLQTQDIKIAIATADDRTPTEAMLEAFDVAEFVSTMVCADDGIPSKPQPDMVLEICKRINVEPVNTMVIGDTTSDLKMARAAGAGLVIGVLSGVSNAQDLGQHADLLIESIDELSMYIEELADQSSTQTKNGLNPDFAF